MQEFLRTYGSWLLVAFNLVMSLALFAIRNSIATKADVTGLNERIAKLEHTQLTAPTPAQISDLRLDMEKMRGELGRWTAEFRGARDTLAAEQEGLRQLVVRTENMVGLIQEHELRRGGAR